MTSPTRIGPSQGDGNADDSCSSETGALGDQVGSARRVARGFSSRQRERLPRQGAHTQRRDDATAALGGLPSGQPCRGLVHSRHVVLRQQLISRIRQSRSAKWAHSGGNSVPKTRLALFGGGLL